MDQAVRQAMSPEEFLAWEQGQEFQWEFDGFEPVAMNGGTQAHSIIQSNLVTALNNRLRGTPCRVHGGHLKLQIGRKYRYPDAFVACGQVVNGASVSASPVVVFEVMSESTEGTDKTAKLLEYRSLPSVQRYVLLEQHMMMVTTYTRVETLWAVDQYGAEDTVRMPEIGIEVPVSEFYMDLRFAELTGDE